MSAGPLTCPQCGRPCTYLALQPATVGQAPAYTVQWACAPCGQNHPDTSLLGPIVPSPGDCLNCGHNDPANPTACTNCGLEAGQIPAHMGISEPALRKPLGNARVAFAQGHYRQGLALLNITLAGVPSLTEAWEMKLDFMLRLGYTDLAAQMLRRAIDTGASKTLYRQLGTLLLDAHDVAAAIDAMQEFVLHSDAPMKEKAEELSNIGNILAEAGATEEAEQALTEAANMDSLNPRIAQNLAAFLAQQGRVEEASDVCGQALLIAAQTDERADLLALQGYLHALAGDIELGIGTLELALSAGKDDPQTRVLIAQLHILAGQPQAAPEHLQAVLQQDPAHPEALALLHQIQDTH